MENKAMNDNSTQEPNKLSPQYIKRAKNLGNVIYVLATIIALILLLGFIGMIGSKDFDREDVILFAIVLILDALFFILGYMFKKKPEKIMHPESGYSPTDLKKFKKVNDDVIEQINKTYNVTAPHMNFDIPPLIGIGNIKRIVIYDCGSYWHFVTIGISRLCDVRGESKREYTLKLKKNGLEEDSAELINIGQKLQEIAGEFYTGAKLIRDYQSLSTEQADGIDANSASKIAGFITIPDTTLRPVATSDGEVSFVEFVGVTGAELKSIDAGQTSVKELYSKIGTDITDYNRNNAA